MIERDAAQGIGAVFMGATGIAGALAGAHGYVLPAMIAGGCLIAAGAMLVTSAIGNKERKQ
jgi:hypothetical protein